MPGVTTPGEIIIKSTVTCTQAHGSCRRSGAVSDPSSGRWPSHSQVPNRTKGYWPSIFTVLGNEMDINTGQNTLCVCTMGLGSSLRRSFGMRKSRPWPLKTMSPPSYCDHPKQPHRFAKCLEGWYSDIENPGTEPTMEIQTSDNIGVRPGSSEKQNR